MFAHTVHPVLEFARQLFLILAITIRFYLKLHEAGLYKVLNISDAALRRVTFPCEEQQPKECRFEVNVPDICWHASGSQRYCLLSHIFH